MVTSHRVDMVTSHRVDMVTSLHKSRALTRREKGKDSVDLLARQLIFSACCIDFHRHSTRLVKRKLQQMGFGREMDGCGAFMKYSMFVANFIIFVGGLTVLGIGIWTLVDKSFINELLGTNLFLGAVYILIATGGLVSLVAFFGCLGAVKEIKCMLLMYFIIVFLIFVTMLVGGILGYVFREKVRTTMEQEMHSTLRLYGDKRSITRAWDNTQENLHCCGVTNYNDWRSKGIPESCCKEAPRLDGISRKLPCQQVQSPLNIFTDGCLDVTEMFVKDHASIIGGAGIGVACLMLLGMIFSCALFKMIE